MGARDEAIDAVAARHGLSRAAVVALDEALRNGRGGAQWSHPDLGGMGQWLRGGLLQIGDMFNHGLKARVAAALDELATVPLDPATALASNAPSTRPDWWPEGLGTPSATGDQGPVRYACFPDRRRLVVQRDGTMTVYDTGAHRLTGFAQSQGDTRTLVFTGPDGTVSLDDLPAVR